ncbi:MAG: class I mannose-6-phosphate isomerase [Planctomycetota bacterium]|jgi:mannose-6-phosphate isomerase
MNIPDVIQLAENRVWRTYLGGKMLDKLAGKESPEDAHFPEDWIGSTTRAINKGREDLAAEGMSEVDIFGEKILLKDLIEKSPGETVGLKHFEKYGSQTGFLLKFLDSSIRLHIQCHPTIPFAKKNLNSNSGKTESYVILQTRPEVQEPYIYLGFQNPLHPEDFKEAIVEQNIDKILSCFEKIPVRPGDVFLVPGGLPHAIGEGVFMAEIMEPTDLAVRIEFERGGYVLPDESRFMSRGVDFAVSMFDFEPVSIDTLKEKYFSKPEVVSEFNAKSIETSLIDKRLTECFTVHRLTVSGEITRKNRGFYLGVVASGSGKIINGDESIPLNFGDKFLIPAKSKQTCFASENGLELILTFPPE